MKKNEYFLLKLRVDFACGYKYLKFIERIEKAVISPLN